MCLFCFFACRSRYFVYLVPIRRERRHACMFMVCFRIFTCRTMAATAVQTMPIGCRTSWRPAWIKPSTYRWDKRIQRRSIFSKWFSWKECKCVRCDWKREPGTRSNLSVNKFWVFFVCSPFYGYHRQEHQYLKIFLYNPAMVRRTANLLQNGAILNRVYQPHESHLPYILQFMIDYNLYGMSFLCVPSTVIRYRQAAFADENISCGTSTQSDMGGRRWLDKSVERITTSANEIDVQAVFILNRFQIAINENAEHANPGIAFIWSDERGRRNKRNGKVSGITFDCRNARQLVHNQF